MKKGNLVVPIVIIIIMIFTGIYIFLSSRMTGEYRPSYDTEDFYVKPERVKANEYQVISVTEREMANNYFNDFTLMLFEDLDRAYSKLDESEKKDYTNIYEFKEYVNELTNDFTELPSIDRYEIDAVDGETVYKISDKNGHYYTFYIKGVMKYTISFD